MVRVVQQLHYRTLQGEVGRWEGGGGEEGGKGGWGRGGEREVKGRGREQGGEGEPEDEEVAGTKSTANQDSIITPHHITEKSF